MNRSYPVVLEQLIEFFQKFPGVGEKSAERMALAVLKIPSEEIELASNVLVQAKKTLHPCPVCGNLTDLEKCNVCSDSSRIQNLICVVEDYKSAFAFEREDINLSSLVKRVDSLEDVELILALRSSIEGETTTLYIKKIFEGKKVKISRLSYGLPLGAEIDYLDTTTLDKALEDRKQISE